MTKHWRQRLKTSFYIACVWWTLLFAYHVFTIANDISVQASKAVPKNPKSPTLPSGWDRIPLPVPEKPWCYAFLCRVWPWTATDQRIALFVGNTTHSNAHNVEVSVKEVGGRDLGGQGNRQRDLAMFQMGGAVLPLVDSFGTGKYSNTSLSYQFIPPEQTFEIAMSPEDGEAVVEYIKFGALWECIVNITRVRDGKILRKGVAPPFDMVTGEYTFQWKACQFF